MRKYILSAAAAYVAAVASSTPDLKDFMGTKFTKGPDDKLYRFPD